MNYYLAPMEGLTGYTYRNASHEFFHPMDKYFSPFLVPHQNIKFKTRELRDLLPENNKGIPLIPQVLTNRAQDFLRTARELQDLGYEEININLGCPSKTVTAKNRGAAFLAFPKELHEFLEEIFSKASVKISVKTRLGKENPEEFYELMEIYREYPLEELIIHPRVQLDYYGNHPRMEIFREALERSTCPVCYNGDLFTLEDYENFVREFPSMDRVMFGRGYLANPGIVNQIVGEPVTKEQLRRFHDRMYEEYKEMLSGDVNLLFRMKELWSYMIQLFDDSSKYRKRIKKAVKLADYEREVDALFRERELLLTAPYGGYHGITRL